MALIRCIDKKPRNRSVLKPIFAGARERLPHREKFHKGFFMIFLPVATLLGEGARTPGVEVHNTHILGRIRVSTFVQLWKNSS